MIPLLLLVPGRYQKLAKYTAFGPIGAQHAPKSDILTISDVTHTRDDVETSHTCIFGYPRLPPFPPSWRETKKLSIAAKRSLSITKRSVSTQRTQTSLGLESHHHWSRYSAHMISFDGC